MIFPTDRYIRFDELTQLLQRLAETYPNLVDVSSIGKSYEGRDIWCVTITDKSTGKPEDKPAVWCDANIHATEVSPTTALTYLMDQLTTQFGIDEDITRAVSTKTFYVIPRVNPDGAELFLADSPEAIRSSTRPYPFDDEPLSGLKRQDIDGNGRLLQMRIPDSDGPWKCHPDEPRLMIRRDATERGGTYYRLLPEGIVLDPDPDVLAMTPTRHGLDLNRNFPGHWRGESEQYGAGPYPTSEPEARALVDFIAKHPNICHALTFHTYSGVLLRPYGTSADDSMPAEDLWTFQEIGKKGTELTGYPAISVYHDFKYHPKEVITGVFDDWCYDHFGIYAWTIEIWSPHRQAGITEGFDATTKQGAFKFTTWGRNHELSDDIKLLKWSDDALKGEGYLPWTTYMHPQLGEIEIGGWDTLYAFRNPPSEFLFDEIQRFSKWVIWQALITPELELDVKVTPLSGTNYKVRAIAKNVGFLPTYVSKQALAKKAVRGIVMELTADSPIEFVTGKQRTELGQCEGYHLKGIANSGYAGDTTDYKVVAEWTVSIPQGSTIQVDLKHPKGGNKQAIVNI